jgi:hypothetical protein
MVTTPISAPSRRLGRPDASQQSQCGHRALHGPGPTDRPGHPGHGQTPGQRRSPPCSSPPDPQASVATRPAGAVDPSPGSCQDRQDGPFQADPPRPWPGGGLTANRHPRRPRRKDGGQDLQPARRAAPWLDRRPTQLLRATAPKRPGGHVNLPPKGHADTCAVLDERTVTYLDLTDSGAETAAHLRDDGRITLMFCAISGLPRILRLYGRGRIVLPSEERWDELVTTSRRCSWPTPAGAQRPAADLADRRGVPHRRRQDRAVLAGAVRPVPVRRTLVRNPFLGNCWIGDSAAAGRELIHHGRKHSFAAGIALSQECAGRGREHTVAATLADVLAMAKGILAGAHTPA